VRQLSSLDSLCRTAIDGMTLCYYLNYASSQDVLLPDL